MPSLFEDTAGDGVNLFLQTGPAGLLASIYVNERGHVRGIQNRRRMSVADALNQAEQTAKLYQHNGFRIGGFGEVTKLSRSDMVGAFEKIDQLMQAGSNFVTADPRTGVLSDTYREPRQGLLHLERLRDRLVELLPSVA